MAVLLSGRPLRVRPGTPCSGARTEFAGRLPFVLGRCLLCPG